MQRTRKDRVAPLDLLDDDRAYVVLELHAPGLGVGGAGGSQRKFFSWRCARCTARGQRTAAGAARAAGPPAASCCRWLSRRRLVPLNLLLELRVQPVLLDRTPLWLLSGLLVSRKIISVSATSETRPNPGGILSSRWGVRWCASSKIWHLRAGYPASNLKRFLKQGATRIIYIYIVIKRVNP